MPTADMTNIKFPYKSHFVEVLGSKMHYIDEGQGDSILFLHGMPSSCYLWRNIIPFLSTKARCIAPDLIGMGQSDKPNIKYSVEDHIQYVEAFIKQLGLKNVTIVMHAWGSLPGFSYLAKHTDNVRAVAFLESYIRPVENWDELALPMQELAALLSNEERSRILIFKENYLVENWMPRGIAKELTKYEMAYYRMPFKEADSRQVLWQYTQDLPLAGKNRKTMELIRNYSQVLEKSALPKLMLYSVPGFNTSMASVSWAKQHLTNLKLLAVENSLHYAPESHPRKVGQELLQWFEELT